MAKHLFFGLAALAFVSSAAEASTTVGIANWGNCYPFSCNDSGSPTGQSIEYFQIYAASAFSGPTTFNAISFADGGFRGSGDLIRGTYDITFSTTSAGLGASYPIGPLSNTATFFDQILAASGSLGGLALNGTPYTYNPADGNLVMEVVVSNQDLVPNGSGNSYLAADRSGSATTRAFDITGKRAVNDNAGLVTTFISSELPEPATWVMMLLGLGAIGVSVRRRRKQPPMYYPQFA